MNTLFLDVKYAKIAGASLERYKQLKTEPFLAIARCPICGDSSKKKTRARFYFYEKLGKVNIVCHNCGASMSIGSYLKNHAPALHSQYTFERFTELGGNPISKPVVTTPKKEFDDGFFIPKFKPKEELVAIKDLPDDHPAVVYLLERKIDFQQRELYYAEEYVRLASRFYDDNRFAKVPEHPRIIIPFLSAEGELYGFQARSINGESPKYITTFTDSSDPLKLFGLDKLDLSKPIVVVEGAFDSMFVPNGVAALSSALVAAANTLMTRFGAKKENIVLLFDNEPRNPEIMKLMEKAIKEGYRVLLWRKDNPHKDVNESIQKGFGKNFREVFSGCKIVSGLMGLIEFNHYAKV